eukprot:gene10503-4668_t
MRTSGKDHETAQAMHPRLAFGAAFCSFATGRTRVQPFTSHVCKLACGKLSFAVVGIFCLPAGASRSASEAAGGSPNGFVKSATLGA